MNNPRHSACVRSTRTVRPITATVAFLASLAFLVVGLSLAAPKPGTGFELIRNTLPPIVNAEPSRDASQALPKPAAASREVPVLSLHEAQAKVAFRIPQLRRLPDGLTLKGVFVEPANPNWIRVLYGSSGNATATVSLEVNAGPRTSDYLVNGAGARTVTVNGKPALLVRGAWDKDGQWNGDARVNMVWCPGQRTGATTFCRPTILSSKRRS
jgi:hypothetical protein